MSGLSEAKRNALKVLVDQAPDAVLEAIVSRFQHAADPAASQVAALARAASLDRAVLRLAFGPITPFLAPRPDGVSAPLFPKRVLSRLWEELATRRPDLTDGLTALVRLDAGAEPPTALLDGLSAEGASVLRGAQPEDWGLAGADEADSLAAFLDLAPIARGAIERLPEWLSRMDGDRLTVLRLAFKDADGVREDGRVRLMEILMAQLPNAGAVLRLLAAAVDQPTAAYIAGTEMASFADRLVSHVEAAATRFPAGGPRFAAEEAERATAVLDAVVDILTEFDLSFPGPAGGEWARRLGLVRSRMADQLETAFRGVARQVDRALPLASSRLAGRMSRMAPDLSADPDSPAVADARALLSLLAGARSAAAALGCESLRKQTAEAAAERIDSYAEEVLQLLHDNGAEDPRRALALLETAAEFLALTRGEDAGALVRRRAAVALAGDARLGDAAA